MLSGFSLAQLSLESGLSLFFCTSTGFMEVAVDKRWLLGAVSRVYGAKLQAKAMQLLWHGSWKAVLS